MKRLVGLVMACASIGNWGCQMQSNRGGALAQMVEVLPVEHLPEYVIGFPMYVALTVRAKPNAVLSLLTFPDFLDLRDHVGLVMSTQDGREVVRYMPAAEAHGDERPTGDRLNSGETRRMLIDISPLVPGSVNAGDYSIRIAWAGVGETYEAPPTTIKLRQPTSDEMAQRTAIAPDRDRYPSWAAWTRTCSEAVSAPGRINPNDPLAFNAIVRRLFCSPIGPDRADADELLSLGGLFAPERDALTVELYQARGNSAEASRLMAQLAGSQPGLAWWLRPLAAGHGGFVTAFRNPVPPRR